jgi:hypothetical protein
MEFLNAVRDNWFELFQSVFIAGSYLLQRSSAKEEARQRRVSNRLEILNQYREIWKLRLSHPELNRIDDPFADLTTNSITAEERLFMRFLILHLSNSYRAAKLDVFTLPEEMGADIANVFSRPIPLAVWEQVRRFQNADFVNFVEEHRGR